MTAMARVKRLVTLYGSPLRNLFFLYPTTTPSSVQDESAATRA
jgi:hypothetical protein